MTDTPIEHCLVCKEQIKEAGDVSECCVPCSRKIRKLCSREIRKVWNNVSHMVLPEPKPQSTKEGGTDKLDRAALAIFNELRWHYGQLSPQPSFPSEAERIAYRCAAKAAIHELKP